MEDVGGWDCIFSDTIFQAKWLQQCAIIKASKNKNWRNESQYVYGQFWGKWKPITLFLKRNATFWKLPFFWRRVYTSESGVIHISHDPGSHDPDPGPQEKSMKKSCVSFETECTIHQTITLSGTMIVLQIMTLPRWYVCLNVCVTFPMYSARPIYWVSVNEL